MRCCSTPDGWVAEGTVWNVFWWDATGCAQPARRWDLPGIGRARVLDSLGTVDPARGGPAAYTAIDWEKEACS